MNKQINSIEEDNKGITLRIGPSNYKYFIDARDYSHRINGNISECIHQVMQKSWSDVESLYALGAMLSKHTFRSGIDWNKTFFMVEKKQLEEIVSKQLFYKQSNTYFKKIELGYELSTEFMHDEITRKVYKKLEEYGFNPS